MPTLGPMEWILILLVLVLLFGAKKLPDTAKALGQSLRMFKKETSKLSDEEADDAVRAKTEPAAAAQLPPAGPSVEERLRTLEEENRRLKESQAPVSAQAQNERNPG
ncbi:Sec-independent protein translocase subunit TatA [Sphaerimonospora thailandensis]|uniref:Sec-independent protein translocase protein TatA n=1 Tax=Sphaerimonospora thailandensis TaxID=795644 RepID=A0A8J3VZV2_9ACTN|nr:Sec-independent protein translocase subunit TatA [Sphaerimonospora thailandensis]GIH71569.1 Sec-independent protein translocase protein TatA [Sphaerimonospora thailandensis]